MADGERRDAAVVLGVRRGPDGDLRLVVVERGRGGRHGGQIALPGGNREPQDVDLRATAVRETCEEIGTTPEQVVVLEGLDAVETRTTGYRVWPFVARLRVEPGHVWVPQVGEIAAVHELSVATLMSPATAGERRMTFAGWEAPRVVPVRVVGDLVVWGLTLRLIDTHLPGIAAGRLPV